MQISGLISHLADNDELFLRKVDLGYEVSPEFGRLQTPAHSVGEMRTTSHIFRNGTDFSADNFAAERYFKMYTLSWLSNGKPKLMRSPGEGNFIVYLMNVSMTPNDTLGRMLHTFTAAASEIAECSMENLIAYNLAVGYNHDENELIRMKYFTYFKHKAQYLELLDNTVYNIHRKNNIVETLLGPAIVPVLD
jgi:hypothetical protein